MFYFRIPNQAFFKSHRIFAMFTTILAYLAFEANFPPFKLASNFISANRHSVSSVLYIRTILLRNLGSNSPFYPRVTYAIIQRDIMAGVHSCTMLGYFIVVTYGHSLCKRAHAASTLYRITYFSEYALKIEKSCFSMVKVPSQNDLPFASYFWKKIMADLPQQS